MATILFYSPINDLTIFQRVGFYSTDINILRDLGHEVILTNSLIKVAFKKYDILFAYFYTWSAFASIIAWLKFKKTIITGGADELEPSYNKSKEKLFIHRSLFRLGHFFSSWIIPVSNADLNNFVKLVGNKKISLIPHAVDTNLYNPSGKQNNKLFLTIGWMGTEANVRRKGMLDAIKVLAELRSRQFEADLIIAGTPGPGLSILKELAQKLHVNDHIEYRLNVTEKEKIELLKRCGYYLQLSEFEGFGLAALEALSCGSCVVHTGRGGLSDFMADYGLTQKWPLEPSKIAEMIICENEAITIENCKSKVRHLHVDEKFSLSMRRKAFSFLLSK